MIGERSTVFLTDQGRLPNFLREVFSKSIGTLMPRSEFAMGIKEIYRSRNKRFTDGANCAPLLYRRTVEIVL